MDTYYLVDFENVNSDGLKGCNKLGEKTFIDIFFTENASKIDMNKIADCEKADILKVYNIIKPIIKKYEK